MSQIEIKGVYHRYNSDSFELTIDSLVIKNGETVALVGESGCGKTTVLRSIAGLETPTRGEILIDQKTVCSEKIYFPPEKRNVGLVFQDYALFPHLTVKKNILFGLRKFEKNIRDTRLKEILSLTKLDEFLHRYPHELSGGQQQRVALARALICKPSVLLLDEPFSNLDEILKLKLRKDIKDLIKDTSTTTILVTHDIRDAIAVADRIVILHHGKVEQEGSIDEMKENPSNNYVKALMSTI